MGGKLSSIPSPSSKEKNVPFNQGTTQNKEEEKNLHPHRLFYHQEGDRSVDGNLVGDQTLGESQTMGESGKSKSIFISKESISRNEELDQKLRENGIGNDLVSTVSFSVSTGHDLVSKQSTSTDSKSVSTQSVSTDNKSTSTQSVSTDHKSTSTNEIVDTLDETFKWNPMDNGNSLIQEDPFEAITPIEDRIDSEYAPNKQDPLYQFCESLAINGTIMTTMTDSGYLDLFYAFYTSSHMERYPNFFATALDENAYNELKSNNIPVYLYKAKDVSEKDLLESSLITSKQFQKKVVNKLQYISHLLSFTMRVLYMDCDIILFKNPWRVLNAYTHHNADVVAQKDDSLNSGFMYLFPTEITREMIKHASNYMLTNNELDQESILAVLPRFRSLRLILLPEDQFSNGKVFFRKYQFYWDTANRHEIMMHNNFIVGSSNKLYRLRELLYYNDNANGYYSSMRRQYLIVDASEERLRSPLYLRQVAYMSHVLNRTFLLPLFPCPPGFTAKKCNLCRDDVECYKSFRKLIQGNYRDYVCLSCLTNV